MRGKTALGAVLVVAAALPWVAAWAGPSAGPSLLSCDLGAGRSVSARVLVGAVVQPSDLPWGWRFEHFQTLPKGTSADGPSSHRLGGAVAFANRPRGPYLSLTSVAELEASPSAACRTYQAWLRTLLSAGVGARYSPVSLQLGRERARLDSNEIAFGQMVSISWYRGSVYAEVQVQYRSAHAAAAARRAALVLAAASDARIGRTLR